MLTDVIRIDAGMDQEEVAKVFEKYGLLGMPVVDHDNTPAWNNNGGRCI